MLDELIKGRALVADRHGEHLCAGVFSRILAHESVAPKNPRLGKPSDFSGASRNQVGQAIVALPTPEPQLVSYHGKRRTALHRQRNSMQPVDASIDPSLAHF